MQTLFDTIDNAIFKPLAERMRPLELADYVGQVEIVGEASGIKKMIENVGGNISGVVINKVPVNAKKYEHTYYYENKERGNANND